MRTERRRWDLGHLLEYGCCSIVFTVQHRRAISIATSIPLSVHSAGAWNTHVCILPNFSDHQGVSMYLYEHVIREHELRVAKSLERYDRRKGRQTDEPQGLVLFAKARKAIRRR
jgi:hypothetical protein